MKRRIVWINAGLALLLVAVGIGAYAWLFRPAETVATGRTVAVQTGTVSETVTATGTVETAGALELSFATVGTVESVRVEEGDRVRSNRVLARLDDTSAQQSVISARSSYVQAVGNADQSTLSLAAAQQAVEDAQTTAALNKQEYAETVRRARADLADAKAAWSDSCLDAAGTCPDAEAWSQLRAAEADVTSAKSAYDQAVQTASATETTNNIKLNQAQMDVSYAKADQDAACNTYGSSSNQCTSAVSATRNAQQQYELQANANQTASVQSQQSLANADVKITQANIALKKLQNMLVTQAADAISTAQDAVESALLSQEKGLASGAQSVSRAKETLAAQQASARTVTTPAGSTTANQAAIAVAEAGLTSAREAVSDTVLRAPVAGTVASVTVTEGDSAAAGTPVITLLPNAALQVVASFSEADALKVEVGQSATVTFDALPDASATATVTAVDILPSTGESGVTTYGATLTLDDSPEGVRQGMSASVVVTTAEATNVLWAPTAAITTSGGTSTVTVRANGVDTPVTVTTGLAGDTGTQITSGVASGDQLVMSTSDGSGGFTFPVGGIPGGLSGGGGPPAGGPPAGVGGPS